MTSSMTPQGGLKVGPLYSYMNEIVTFFMITKQRAKISSLNFLCICIIRIWLQLYEYIFMTSLMTSPGHKIGQIFLLIYLSHYLHYSVDQKLKMSDMLLAIFLVYYPSGITSGKKFCRELKMAAILKILKYQTQLQFDLRYENIVPNYAKKSFFMVMTSSMTSKGRLKVSLYIHVKERVAPGANCKGNVSSINANIIIVFLGYTCQKMIALNYTFRDCRSKVNITGLLGDLGTNK